jgi:hypothetical protein
MDYDFKDAWNTRALTQEQARLIIADGEVNG